VHRRLAAAALLSAFAAAAPSASAEPAWVRGAPLNLRSGAGIEHPVLASLAPGERIELLASAGEWARVRRADGSEGWLAASYLVRDEPPTARIAALEAELERKRQELASAAQDAEAQRRRREDDSRAGAEREDAMLRLRRENDALRAGARWPEWITGALILATGMAFGAVVRGVSGRRRQTRLRL
jgi:hypothetical protein